MKRASTETVSCHLRRRRRILDAILTEHPGLLGDFTSEDLVTK